MNTNTFLTISFIRGVGKKTLQCVYEYYLQHDYKISLDFETVDGLFADLNQTNKKIKSITKEEFDKACEKAEIIYEKSEKAQVKIISPLDKSFPDNYRNIPSPPFFLHYRGNIDCLHDKCVAIIGTREPSDYGIKHGKRLSDVFVDAEFTIVSGLAIGCDTLAHRAAVQKNKKTAAILAGGLQSIYPKENLALTNEILDNDGVLISEYEYGVPGLPNYFVERDRLQSGASEGVVVIETRIKGGTRHTVRFANEQQRLVGCLFTHTRYSAEHLDTFQGNKEIVEKENGIPLTDEASVNEFIKRLEERFIEKQKGLNITGGLQAEKPDLDNDITLAVNALGVQQKLF